MFRIFKKIVFYLVLVYGIFGFVILPLIVKPQIIKTVAEETNAQIEIGSIYFNPFLFKFNLSNVVLKNLEDKELISFKNFFIDLELYSLASKTLHVSKITLVDPKISLVYEADKSLNLLNILKETKSTQEDNSSMQLPRIMLDEVSIEGGEVLYNDYTLKTLFEFSFHKIGLMLKDLDTQESQDKDAQIRFYATLGDGGFIDFRSKINSLSPFIADGSLDFEASKLYTQWKYVQDMTNLEVADGKISLYTKYQVNLEDINATKIEDLVLKIEKFRMKAKSQDQDMLNINELSIAGATIEPFKKNVQVDMIALDGLSLFAKRQSDGSIDWLDYLVMNSEENSTSPSVAKSEEKVTNSQAWNVLLKEISLEKIALGFDDKAISPSVNTQVNELNISAKDVSLSGEKPFTYSLNMLLNNKALCNSKGSITHKNLDIKSSLTCRDFDVVHYNPYIETAANKALNSYNIDLKTLRVNADADIHLKESNATYALLISKANLAFNDFQVNKKGSKKELLGFQNFLINGIHVDTNAKSVRIEDVTLNKLIAKLERYKSGSLNVEHLIEAKKSDNSPKEEKSYSLEVKHFGINNSTLAFKDDTLALNVTNKIDAINANAYDLDLKENSWLKYNLSMKVNSKGSVKAKGKLRHTPLKQSGSFEIKNLSLIELTPYLQESAYVSIEDGKLSLKGTTEYAKSSHSPDLRVEGSIGLKSFFVNETLDNTQLLSFGDVAVDSYTFELNPNRLHVDEVDINSFYVDAKIDENKTLNFSKLMKKNDENLSVEVTQKSLEKSAPATFPYRILKVKVALGSARFADYSIPIKFLTHIHDLNGAIYAISNTPGDTSYVDIDGEVDKYASTSLKGSIDSASPKAYTDLDFNFKNLNLKSLSGYSANFAGYEIDSGKLYLDLGYNILDSQLLGTNSIIVKHIKLGNEIEDENVTVLPLGFVIGLLEDSNGIMDIDMPVEGNLDEPDFKYGRLVLKTFVNLIAKAVTSPFKFLSSAMGIEGDNLEYIAYESGSSEITPPQREKLDKIAQMMLKKPKILLSVAGKYELKKDTEALQLQKLIELVVKKSGVKNLEDHQSIMNIDMLEDIYLASHDNDLLKQIQERLHKKYVEKATYERAYNNELLILCRNTQEITKNELLTLANARADNIVGYLVGEKMLEAQKITKRTSQILEEDADTEIIKVDMEIKVK